MHNSGGLAEEILHDLFPGWIDSNSKKMISENPWDNSRQFGVQPTDFKAAFFVRRARKYQP